MPEPAHGELYRAVFGALPIPCLLIDRDLVILQANPAYSAALARDADDLVGRKVFEAFPENPDDPQGVLEASLRRALAGSTDRMPLIRYDVETEPGSGVFGERWWTLVNVPVVGGDGDVGAVLHVVDDVTAVVQARERSLLDRSAAQASQERADGLEVDLLGRVRELRALAESEAAVSRRLAGLADAALALAAAETVDDLAAVVIERGLSALGADGGAVAVRVEGTDTLRLTVTDSLGPDVQRQYGELPLDGPLPASVAARTGEAVILGDGAAGLRFAPEMAAVHATTGKVAWASMPLRSGGRLLGSLTAGWRHPQPFTAADVDLLAAFAAQCAQALDRLLVREAERQHAMATQRLSEALQRSLLTEPPQPDHLQMAVRYVPAAEEARIGGDWYDAFIVAGTTSLVIGDVAGHDRDAAAAMGQVRNVLRGVAHALEAPPAAVLTGLDRALSDLGVRALATAVLVQIQQTQDEHRQGLRTMRWSNAGHPPPLLVRLDGTAELLAYRPELLLGLDPGAVRTDHVTVLEPGCTVLLYTDGLVERRGAPLDAGLRWLRETVERLAHLSLTDLCDALLSTLTGRGEDDVALLAFRAHPEDRPRPPDAGPEVLPAR